MCGPEPRVAGGVPAAELPMMLVKLNPASNGEATSPTDLARVLLSSSALFTERCRIASVAVETDAADRSGDRGLADQPGRGRSAGATGAGRAPAAARCA